ncbi:class I SAM-dependent methyltransferase [Thermoleophilia bacterium SCSIO 60948]|nr:class I SAM-dependent methyltransferase [Thermoleophilia bacterium SCSIO 60948]
MPAGESRRRVSLHGAEQTLLLTLAMRDVDARSKRPVLGDKWAPRLVERIDHPWWRTRLLVAGNAPLVLARARAIDRWATDWLVSHPASVVLHLGCGLDSRPLRLDIPAEARWVDVDRPRVIELRRELYGAALDHAEQVVASIESGRWREEIDAGRPLLVVCEGLAMYLSPAGIESLFSGVAGAARATAVIADSVSDVVRSASRLLPEPLAMGAHFHSSSADIDAAIRDRGLDVAEETSLVADGGTVARGALGISISVLAATPGAASGFVLRRFESR